MDRALQQKVKPRKSRGQSLVEIALMFPVLIMLFAGVVEFGFIINYYLSLLDATRESARFWSQGEPFTRDPVTKAITGNDLDFYSGAANTVLANLDPVIENPAYVGRRISLDPSIDDVIVTVYAVDKVHDTITAYPGDTSDGAYHVYNSINYHSIFSVDSIRNTLVVDAPNAGILIVEVHYNYHQVLALPWITAVLPNPLHLRAYTIFPINAAEPVIP